MLPSRRYGVKHGHIDSARTRCRCRSVGGCSCLTRPGYVTSAIPCPFLHQLYFSLPLLSSCFHLHFLSSRHTYWGFRGTEFIKGFYGNHKEGNMAIIPYGGYDVDSIMHYSSGEFAHAQDLRDQHVQFCPLAKYKAFSTLKVKAPATPSVD
ncbi:hypothetical protein BCR34DRAFT_555565 [Clohesyomyces aquaticus]|uniref:Uncharacterized protein n=1 Tax=Clohesyomyces aquaticus TaxID=1231657 RepID=A0A1Y2A4S3_9PLEO|nr:hypothetical protein BCR34DRAFT_555565 [Clohesyomyces aquaticus]